MAERWHGVTVQKVEAPIDKAWGSLREFAAMDKWAKSVKSCERIEGEEAKPGCVRVLKSNLPGGSDGAEIWAKEKLTVLDDEKKIQKYDLLGSNMGLTVGYKGSIKVDPLDEKSCTVTWGFETNPVEGTTEEELAQRMAGGFEGLLKSLEEHCA